MKSALNERLPYRRQLVEFGERVYIMQIRFAGAIQAKLTPKWQDGAFIGIRNRSEIMTTSGVCKTRKVRRRPESEREDFKFLHVLSICFPGLVGFFFGDGCRVADGVVAVVNSMDFCAAQTFVFHLLLTCDSEFARCGRALYSQSADEIWAQSILERNKNVNVILQRTKGQLHLGMVFMDGVSMPNVCQAALQKVENDTGKMAERLWGDIFNATNMTWTSVQQPEECDTPFQCFSAGFHGHIHTVDTNDGGDTPHRCER